MSVAARAPSRLRSRFRLTIPPAKLYFWCISLLWLAFLGWELVAQGGGVLTEASTLLPWGIVLAVLNLLPVTKWDHVYLTADVPISVAGMLVLSPLQIGVVTLVSSFDPREFRGRVHLAKSIFNRSQISLAVFLGSTVVHAAVPSPTPSSFILLLAILSLATITTFNYALTGIGVSLEHGYSISGALHRMRVGSLSDYLLTLASWGVLGAMVATLYDQVGPVALLAFLAPTLLGRQALVRSQMSIDTARAYRSREAALSEITNQVRQERMDERRMIAADLHDEVMQPLFKVTLAAQVLKADLASGRLLEMDQDLPDLLAAAQIASNSLRDLIGDLRRSALGRGGLAPALLGLVRQLGKHTDVQFHSDVTAVSVRADAELVLYQIAKEALSNAIIHSRATTISLELRDSNDGTHLKIEDDGVGFDPFEERPGHYGLAIMRERASTVGAEVFLDSAPARGCVVNVTLRPAQATKSPQKQDNPP